MGFISTGSSDIVVYLTPLGAEYLAGRKKSATDLSIKYFTLGDSDANYLVQKRSQKGYIPDLTGEDSSCLKIAYDEFKYFLQLEGDTTPIVIDAFYNIEKSNTLTRNDCTEGIPTAITYTVPAHSYSSTISQADADAQAQADVDANAQRFANSHGSCIVTTYYNIAKSNTYTRNNCGVNAIGTPVTYSVPANSYTSTISQADADSKADQDIIANGQNYANTNGTCVTTLYYSVAKFGAFTRSNCGDGYNGGSGIYQVAAGAYTSSVSQAAADALAQADVNANGPTWVNNPANGVVCNYAPYGFQWIVDDTADYCEVQFASTDVGIIVVDLYNATDGNFASIINTPGVNILDGIAYTGKNFVDSTDIAANAWMLASDVSNGATKWRFEFNVAKLISYYPGINIFTMQLIGRGTSAATISGAYSYKGADQGEMTMTGAPGSYIPSNANTNNLGLVNTTYTIAAGANGTYSSSLPVIKTFSYNKTTQALTVT